MTSISDINKKLDELLIELLALIEQYTKCCVKIEGLMITGLLSLAKTRYTQGSQTVSIAQLPTENQKHFKALCRVVTEPKDSSISGYHSELINYEVNKLEGYVEPLHWFSVLAPASLKLASGTFKRSLPIIVESANIQREMITIMNKIDHLKLLKTQMS